ncbi:aldehyde dehydrogenase family protein [Pseudoalteromonas rubra]|uniref:Succinate-semialdehyde dehydrogenase n=1 Tax=Pseudoalteromonas rubra TaxID=43658 RepID=A0A0U2Y3Z6_9GAMM|nr:succinate-semialdehyde dehydrogenase [Pseudoalteromonas rubra]
MINLLHSFDPSSGDSLGQVPVSDQAQISDVVIKAKDAANSWAKLTHKERLNMLNSAFSHCEPHVDALAKLLSQEMGKDLRRATSEVQGCLFGGPYIAVEAMSALQSELLHKGSRLEYRPFGVTAVISPWNYPLMMACNLIVPALIAGNTVVLKPSEETPLIAEKWVSLMNEVLPEHVLQIVHGGKDTGQALVESDVNMVAFTGSMAAGKDIMRRAAGGVKRLVMELGGNDPMIVLDDANIETAAHFAVASSLENTGQMCTSTERILVDEKIAERFERRVVELASRYRAGAWHEPNINMGPIINARQHEKIVKQIDNALSNGARLLLGEEQHTLPYIKPVVLTGITPQMDMWSEETFGPVIAITHFDSLDEAVRLANDSEYGLGAAVFGQLHAQTVADQLEAGMVGVNQGPGASGDAPWVGAKQSGFGFHGSAAGHRQFAQVRVMSTR